MHVVAVIFGVQYLSIASLVLHLSKSRKMQHEIAGMIGCRLSDVPRLSMLEAEKAESMWAKVHNEVPGKCPRG